MERTEPQLPTSPVVSGHKVGRWASYQLRGSGSKRMGPDLLFTITRYPIAQENSLGLSLGIFQKKLKIHGWVWCVHICMLCMSIFNNAKTSFFVSFLLCFLYSICLVYACGCAYSCYHTLGGQSSIDRCQFSPSITWLPRVEQGQPIWWQDPLPLCHHMGPLTTIYMQLLQNAWLHWVVALEYLWFCLWMTSAISANVLL